MDEKGVAAGLIALKDSLKWHTTVRCLFVASGLEWLCIYKFGIVLCNHLLAGDLVSLLKLHNVRERCFA